MYHCTDHTTTCLLLFLHFCRALAAPLCRLDDFGAVFNKMMATCGHPSAGQVTPCTLTALKVTTASLAEFLPEEQELLAEAVPVDTSLATVEGAAAQPDNVPVDVQPVPVTAEGAGAVVEGAAGVTTATAVAPGVPVTAGAEQGAVPVAGVAPAGQAAPVPEAPVLVQAGVGDKRRAARKLV
jgi:hypothetical protein